MGLDWNELYSVSRLYYNFFQVVMKLQTKERQGSRVRKKYDQPRTPYQRLLELPYVTKEEKQRLMETYSGLNVVKLKAQLERLQKRLWQLQINKRNCPNFRVDSYVRQ